MDNRPVKITEEVIRFLDAPPTWFALIVMTNVAILSSFRNSLLALISLVLMLNLSSPAQAGEPTEVVAQVNQLDIKTQLDNVSHKIEEAGQRGVGTKGYQDVFNGIDAEYKAVRKPKYCNAS